MRRYLHQLSFILRPGSVSGADLALRSLAAFLAEPASEVRFIADIRRHHVEDFRTWLGGRSGYRTARLSTATLAHRLGTLRIMLGIHITVPVAWQRASAGDWADYAAQVSRRPNRRGAQADEAY